MHKADVASALLHQSIPLWLWWTRRHSCILQTHWHYWAVPSQTTKNTESKPDKIWIQFQSLQMGLRSEPDLSHTSDW